MFGRLFGRKGGSDTSAASYSEGMRLFNIAKYHASRFETDKALEFFDKSFEINKRPEPLVDRAHIKALRIRHYEAYIDLLEAKRLDEMHGKACEDEILRRLAKLSITTHLYKDDTREQLIADLRTNGRKHAASRILCTCFKIDPEQWRADLPPATPMLKYHFFNEVDNIAKFDSRGSYPDIDRYIDLYPGAFIEATVRLCPNAQEYLNSEVRLQTFLCSYEEQDMRNVRSDMLYLIHSALMWADYGHEYYMIGSDNHIIREALEYLDQ